MAKKKVKKAFNIQGDFDSVCNLSYAQVQEHVCLLHIVKIDILILHCLQIYMLFGLMIRSCKRYVLDVA